MSQKRELGDRFYEVLQENKITFQELTAWYLDLESVKRLKSYRRYRIALENFNHVFGGQLVKTIKAVHLENYQRTRHAQGMLPATIDYEISAAHRAVRKADDNDLVDLRALKAFKRTKNLLRTGENARDRILAIEEYLSILANASEHLQPILIVGMNTGMRGGEILGLKWSYIDQKKQTIRLPAQATKEKRPKNIPINAQVGEVLQGQRFVTSLSDHDHVFTLQGRSVNNIRLTMKSACKRSGILYGRETEGGVIFHDIRRTVKTLMARAGIDKVYRDTILGHSLQGMDKNYLKPSDEDLHSAIEKYSSWLQAEIASVDHIVDQEGVAQGII
ncbi:MAG: tyrosine-type recombinase/integrase [Syntrophobacteria bacterium]